MEKNTDLRIIFIGTPDFAVESLKCIFESGRNVVAVITAPDKKSGRGQQLQQSAVKKYAVNQNLPVLQPTNLKDTAFLEELESYKANLQVVVAFRMLPEAVWNMPELGTFNLHASLLPNYRGAAPINWAIINGETETGVSTFFLKHEIDTGDLLLQEKIAIESDETAGILHDKLMNAGGKLVLRSLDKIESGSFKLIDQNELISEKLNFAPKIYKESCRIKWNQEDDKVSNFIRGLGPFPGAWTTLTNKLSEDSKQLKIFDCKKAEIDVELKVGEIKVESNQLYIGTSAKALEILLLQIEGKRRMTAKELLNGFDINDYLIQ